MNTDGYIFTPELLQWRYFHRPVVVQVLIHVLLSSAHNELPPSPIVIWLYSSIPRSRPSVSPSMCS